MQNCNFFTVVGLTHDERCFIHRASDVAPKQPGSKHCALFCFGVLFSNKSTITENLLMSISWNRPLWKNGTSCRSASLTAALTNGVVVLLMLYSNRVDTLSSF